MALLAFLLHCLVLLCFFQSYTHCFSELFSISHSHCSVNSHPTLFLKETNQVTEIEIPAKSGGGQILSSFTSSDSNRADFFLVFADSLADHLCLPPHSSFNHIAKGINGKLPFGITQCLFQCTWQEGGQEEENWWHIRQTVALLDRPEPGGD